jgi:protein arginine kinase
LKTKKGDVIEDRISRAYATLEGAHMITSKETIELLSLVRLGVDLGFLKDLKDIDIPKLNELFILIQPAHLQRYKGKELSASERDIERADLIRNRLGIK